MHKSTATLYKAEVAQRIYNEKLPPRSIKKPNKSQAPEPTAPQVFHQHATARPLQPSLTRVCAKFHPPCRQLVRAALRLSARHYGPRARTTCYRGRAYYKTPSRES